MTARSFANMRAASNDPKLGGKRMTKWGLLVVALAAASASASCTDLELDPPPKVIHARFDPDARVIPMPTDILRDAAAGRLEIPLDDPGLSDAERELYAWMNTLDGWSSAAAA